MRSIKYIITSTDITPKIEKYGGVQGDHNTTKLVFDVTDVYSSSDTQKRFRIEFIDGSGIYNTSGHLTVYVEEEKYYVSFLLGKEITVNGGSVQFNLLMVSLDDENTENEILSSYPVRVYFAPSAAAAYGSQAVKKGIDGLTLAASVSAQEAAEAADKAAAAANNVENAVSTHNTDESSHQDIRQGVNAVGNMIVTHNSDTTSHQDIRDTIDTLGSTHVPELIKAHDASTSSHQDIRDTIDILGSVHVPESIKSHDSDTSAHQDIRDTIDTLGSIHVPESIKTHNSADDAHADIREELAGKQDKQLVWQLVDEVTLTEEVMVIQKSTDKDGNDLKLKGIKMLIQIPSMGLSSGQILGALVRSNSDWVSQLYSQNVIGKETCNASCIALIENGHWIDQTYVNDNVLRGVNFRYDIFGKRSESTYPYCNDWIVKNGSTDGVLPVGTKITVWGLVEDE